MKFTKSKVQKTREFDAAELSFRHLQAELSRIDVLIRQAVRQWQVAGQNPDDALRGLYLAPDSVNALVTRRFGTNWGDGAQLPPNEAEAFARALASAQNDVNALVEMGSAQDTMPRLLQLRQAFGLSEFDVDALLICLAPSLDLRYEQLYGFLQDDVTRKQPSVNLLLDLLCEARPERLLKLERFADGAPLLKYDLLQRLADQHGGATHMLSQLLKVNETAVAWLLGRYQPQAELGNHAILSNPDDTENDRILLGELMPIIGRSDDAQTILIFYGPDQMSQRAAARQTAYRMKRPLLTVDLSAAVNTEVSALQAVRWALRDARLTGALLSLIGWDVVLNEDAPPSDLMYELCAHPDTVLILGQKQWQTRQLERDRNLVWFEFPVPGYGQRVSLWQHFIGDNQTSNISQETIEALAGQFLLTAAQIRDGVNAAKDVAVQEQQKINDRTLFAAARSQSSPGLGNLARKITPRYNWSDIVLPDDQIELLSELVRTVRGRSVVLEQWGLGRKLTASNGVTVLFAGPPGTGKTMAAEVVASELGLDLYKIDLSTIVSKYIGETEKNLDRIFAEAESSNAILFFDEADAIFGKRSEVKDAHDRYANIEVSYLLQRMEAYNGVTVLATNLRANLDEAFTRRLQFAVDFPFPDEVYRLKIWTTLFPVEVPRDDSVDFATMAKRFRLAGGNIRNIIVSAAYLAANNGGRVTMAHLMHGTRRELQKMGRLVNEKDLKYG